MQTVAILATKPRQEYLRAAYCKRASLKSNPTNFDAAYKKFVEDVKNRVGLGSLTPSRPNPSE